MEYKKFSKKVYKCDYLEKLLDFFAVEFGVEEKDIYECFAKFDSVKKDKCEHIIEKTQTRCKLVQFSLDVKYCKKHAALYLTDKECEKFGLTKKTSQKSSSSSENENEVKETCAYEITRGQNKGNRCKGNTKYNGYCCKHKQYAPDPEPEPETEDTDDNDKESSEKPSKKSSKSSKSKSSSHKHKKSSHKHHRKTKSRSRSRSPSKEKNEENEPSTENEPVKIDEETQKTIELEL
jgi:hypothetical protein